MFSEMNFVRHENALKPTPISLRQFCDAELCVYTVYRSQDR